MATRSGSAVARRYPKHHAANRASASRLLKILLAGGLLLAASLVPSLAKAEFEVRPGRATLEWLPANPKADSDQSVVPASALVDADAAKKKDKKEGESPAERPSLGMAQETREAATTPEPVSDTTPDLAEVLPGPPVSQEPLEPIVDPACVPECPVACCPQFGCTPNLFWFRAEWLSWWGKGMSTPPLLTTSPQDTPRNQAGVGGQPDTSVLFGGGRGLLEDSRSGGRFTFGWWIDNCQDLALEVNYVVTEYIADGYFASSTGDPILARPFFNVQRGIEDARLLAYPNVTTGALDVYARSRFEGAEATVRHALLWDGCDRVDLLAGYRFGDLRELLRTHAYTISTDPAGPAAVGTTMSVLDTFDVKNEFHGAELGVSGHMQRCRWSADLLLKLALGNTHSRVALSGSTTTTAPPDPTPAVYDTGFLVLDTNRGIYSHNEFSVIPELGLTLGYDLTPRLRATAGYTFIYWSRVARPGDQIDLDLNPTQFPPNQLDGGARPRFPFAMTDFWLQGINVGLDYRY